MTAIQKMVEYLDSSASIGASRSENIRIAKRLALEEAKEKPVVKENFTTDLWGQHKQMVRLAEEHGLNLAANWALEMSVEEFECGEYCPIFDEDRPSCCNGEQRASCHTEKQSYFIRKAKEELK